MFHALQPPSLFLFFHLSSNALTFSVFSSHSPFVLHQNHTLLYSCFHVKIHNQKIFSLSSPYVSPNADIISYLYPAFWYKTTSCHCVLYLLQFINPGFSHSGSLLLPAFWLAVLFRCGQMSHTAVWEREHPRINSTLETHPASQNLQGKTHSSLGLCI